MRDELATVLRLVADGTLSPDEAAPLIEALSHAPGGSTRSGLQPDRLLERGPQPPPSPPPVGRSDPRQVRIRVMERGRQVVNLRIPLAFADTALRMVPGLSEEQGNRIRAAIAGRTLGTILDVEDEDGDGVLISME